MMCSWFVLTRVELYQVDMLYMLLVQVCQYNNLVNILDMLLRLVIVHMFLVHNHCMLFVQVCFVLYQSNTPHMLFVLFDYQIVRLGTANIDSVLLRQHTHQQYMEHMMTDQLMVEMNLTDMVSMTRYPEQGRMNLLHMRNKHAVLVEVELSQGHRLHMLKHQTRVERYQRSMVHMRFVLSHFDRNLVHRLCTTLVHQLLHMYRQRMIRMNLFQVEIEMIRVHMECMLLIRQVVQTDQVNMLYMMIVVVDRHMYRWRMTRMLLCLGGVVLYRWNTVHMTVVQSRVGMFQWHRGDMLIDQDD
jgi:hypothetical protein